MPSYFIEGEDIADAVDRHNRQVNIDRETYYREREETMAEDTMYTRWRDEHGYTDEEAGAIIHEGLVGIENNHSEDPFLGYLRNGIEPDSLQEQLLRANEGDTITQTASDSFFIDTISEMTSSEGVHVEIGDMVDPEVERERLERTTSPEEYPPPPTRKINEDIKPGVWIEKNLPGIKKAFLWLTFNSEKQRMKRNHAAYEKGFATAAAEVIRKNMQVGGKLDIDMDEIDSKNENFTRGMQTAIDMHGVNLSRADARHRAHLRTLRDSLVWKEEEDKKNKEIKKVEEHAEFIGSIKQRKRRVKIRK